MASLEKRWNLAGKNSDNMDYDDYKRLLSCEERITDIDIEYLDIGDSGIEKAYNKYIEMVHDERIIMR